MIKFKKILLISVIVVSTNIALIIFLKTKQNVIFGGLNESSIMQITRVAKKINDLQLRIELIEKSIDDKISNEIENAFKLILKS